MTDHPTPPPTVVNVHLDNTNYATAAAETHWEEDPGGRKSAIVAYLALAVGWYVALHRIYLRRSWCRWPLRSSMPSSFPVGSGDAMPGLAPPLARASALTPPPVGGEASGAVVAPHDAPKDLRTRLLRAAHRGDGRLTLTQAVMETEADFGEVETALQALVTAGHIDVDNDPDSGVVLYLFPELVGRPGKAGP